MKFGRKPERQKLNLNYGCVSRREKDFVILATETEGRIIISKLSRKASLETLRLQGNIITTVPNYLARTGRLDDLHYEEETDLLRIGADYLSYLRQQNVNLKEKRAAFTIDPNGTVNGTTAREKDVAEAAISVEGFRNKVDSTCPVLIETRARAALRLYVSQIIANPLEETTVCLSIVEESGYSTVFWSSEKGLCWETEQSFSGQEFEENCDEVADELQRLLNPASLNSLNLTAIDHVVVAASNEGFELLRKELNEEGISIQSLEFTENSNYFLAPGSQSSLEHKIEAIIAAGLCLSDFRIPGINLNIDLETELDLKEQERVKVVQQKTAAASRNLNFLLISPLVLCLTCGLIYYVSLIVQDRFISARLEKAEKEKLQLQKLTQELAEIKTNSETVGAIATEIGILRKKQPANFLLLMTLNRKWPVAAAAWQIDEITSKADGTVTIKGKTRSDESLTEFAKNLDFSEDFEAVKVSKTEGTTNATLAGYTSPLGNGIINFAVEACYSPLAVCTKPAGVVAQPPQSQQQTTGPRQGITSSQPLPPPAAALNQTGGTVRPPLAPTPNITTGK